MTATHNAALYAAAARAHFDAAHPGHQHNPTRVAELVEKRAKDEAFRAAVDTAAAHEEARADRAETETRRLRNRINGALAVITNAGQPIDRGMVAAVLGNVRLALEDSRDPEHTERQAAMSTGRHPAGRRGSETVEATLERISREAPGWQPLPEPA